MSPDVALALPRVVLLCGDAWTPAGEETGVLPTAMVEIGGRPLLWHIMKLYAAHGFTEFVCCLGDGGAAIKRYFLDYHALRSDITVSLATGRVSFASPEVEDWQVSLIDTGEKVSSGARVKRIEHRLGEDELFLCTYGDGLADIELTELLAFHRSHGRPATVTGVRPSVTPDAGPPASAGFFVFGRAALDRLSSHPACALERTLESLAADGQLAVYPHDGFWLRASGPHELERLRALWDSGRAPWRVWDDRRPDPDPPGVALDPRAHPIRRAVDAGRPVLRSVA
jgi:glucose-1-phosphate cytidylyltransferase